MRSNGVLPRGFYKIRLDLSLEGRTLFTNAEQRETISLSEKSRVCVYTRAYIHIFPLGINVLILQASGALLTFPVGI
jgi:hypothetical protein